MTHLGKLMLAAFGAALAAGCAGSGGGEPGRVSGSAVQGGRIAPPAGVLLAGMDRNFDARVSQEEIREAAALVFAAGDADADGALSGIEFTAWSERFLGDPYAVPGRLRFDHDQNGAVSQDEFALTFAAIGDRFDTNGDGEIARSELLVTVEGADIDADAMREQMQAEMRRRVREICRR